MNMTIDDSVVVPSSASGRGVEGVIDDVALEQMMSAASERGVALTGEGGFLPELIKGARQVFRVSGWGG